MKGSKRIFAVKQVLAFALVLSLTLASGLVAWAEGAVDSSLEDIKAKGQFILGLDDSFPPMGYRNEDNEIVGFDIDLAREVCARLGVELVLQPIDWSAKEMELSAGNIDCIWNGMSRNPDREASMALSLDYMNNQIVLMVNQPAISVKEDLAGKVVAVQSGSFAEEVMGYEKYADYRASLKEVRAYPDYQTAIMDLQNGNVDAIAIDLVVANFRIASLEDKALRIVDSLEDDLFCVGFRKDDAALRDAVDQTLKAMAKDGKLDEIATAWFGSNIAIVPAE